MWGEDNSTLIASTYMPTGRATPVEGGWRFSGKWKFSSGIEHCEWVFLGGLTVKDEATGTFIWSESFRLSMANWFEAQQRIIRRIATSLNVQLSAERLVRLAGEHLAS